MPNYGPEDRAKHSIHEASTTVVSLYCCRRVPPYAYAQVAREAYAGVQQGRGKGNRSRPCAFPVFYVQWHNRASRVELPIYTIATNKKSSNHNTALKATTHVTQSAVRIRRYSVPTATSLSRTHRTEQRSQYRIGNIVPSREHFTE